MKDIYFYNYYHYGDVYLNSKFIDDFASKYDGTVYNIIGNLYNEPFEYLFKKAISKKIFEININIANTLSNNEIEVITETYDAYNTHINKIWTLSEKKNSEDYGNIAVNNLANGFERIFQKYNLKLETPIYYIPSIYYNIDLTINTNKKNILICNGPCLSGQIENIPLDYIINFLSKIYNVYITHSLINNNDNSNNDNSNSNNNDNSNNDNSNNNNNNDNNDNNDNIIKLYDLFPIPNIHIIGSIAKKMDIIIGRDSGLFFWTQNRDTIKKKFICFSIYDYKIHKIYNVKCFKTYQITAQDLLNFINT